MLLGLLPAVILVQPLLEQARRLVFAVGKRAHLRVSLLQQPGSPRQVCGVVVDHAAGDAHPSGQALEAALDVSLGRTPHDSQVQQRHVAERQAALQLLILRLADPRDHKAFLDADLHAVVGQERPIIRLVQPRTPARQAGAQPPIPHRGPVRDVPAEFQGARNHIEDASRPAQGNACRADQFQG